MSNPNPNPDNNTPPGTPPNPSASEGTEINPTSLPQYQISVDDINQFLAAVGGLPADTFSASAATPSGPTASPAVNVPTGPSGAMTGPLQANPVSSPSASTSLRSERPPRVRSHHQGPGQLVFQLQPAPTTSTGTSVHSSSPGAHMGLFRSASAQRPWDIHCKCTNRSTKPPRHWKYHCPYNNEIEDLECEHCGHKVGRPDNLARHREQSCPGRREDDVEEDEDEGEEEE